MAAHVLQTTIKEASLFFTRTDGRDARANRKMKDVAKQAVAFIAGTGLDIMINQYELDYDAQAIRESFYRMFNGKK